MGRGKGDDKKEEGGVEEDVEKQAGELEASPREKEEEKPG